MGSEMCMRDSSPPPAGQGGASLTRCCRLLSPLLVVAVAVAVCVALAVLLYVMCVLCVLLLRAVCCVVCGVQILHPPGSF